MLTPDSFSDGGNYLTMPRPCLRRATVNAFASAKGPISSTLARESTRPGAKPHKPLGEERARLMPVLREAVKLGVPVSVDTYKGEPSCVRRWTMGADIINDIWALRQPAMRCKRWQTHPQLRRRADAHAGRAADHAKRCTDASRGYAAPQVLSFLRRAQCDAIMRQLGVQRMSRIGWDVGTGFGKTVEQNFELLAHTQSFRRGSALPPWSLRWSRKSSLGAVTGFGGGLNVWYPAWPQHCWPLSAARASCGCMM